MRAVAVLAFHADLTPHETADALSRTASDVAALEQEAARALAPEAGPSAVRPMLMAAAETVVAYPAP